jgi:hypothetical protein
LSIAAIGRRGEPDDERAFGIERAERSQNLLLIRRSHSRTVSTDTLRICAASPLNTGSMLVCMFKVP